MNEHQVLSSIYKLLSESSEDLFKRIETTGGQPDEILDVVRSLREALVLMDAKYEGSGVGKRKGIRNSRLEVGLDVSEKDWSVHAKKLWNTLRMALSNSKKSGISNKRLVKAFLDSGIKTKARPKEGREKMLLAIQSDINGLDDPKRVRVLYAVLAALGLDQTKGYMDVVKSKSRY